MNSVLIAGGDGKKVDGWKALTNQATKREPQSYGVLEENVEAPKFGFDAKKITQNLLNADKLIKQANDAARIAPNDKVDDAMDQADNALAGAGRTSSKENVGTFSAVGAMLAGMGGGNVQDKIAKSTEETRRNTGKMVEKIADVATNLKNLPQPKFS